MTIKLGIAETHIGGRSAIRGHMTQNVGELAHLTVSRE
jgi:hypothetical protein